MGAADQYAFFQAKGIKKAIAEQQLAAKASDDLRQHETASRGFARCPLGRLGRS